MRYLLTCNLNGDFSDYHKQLVNEIAEKFSVALPIKQKYEPHFTLKYEFETSDINEVEAVIDKFCANHRKSRVETKGFKSFDNKVIFVEIQLSERANQVYLDFVRELKNIPWMIWKEFDGEQRVFHATIAADCKNKFNEIEEYILNKEKYFNCWFDNITIWKDSDVIDDITTKVIHKTFPMF